tara:strand:- start:1248 stop:1442 length:195 start_codon:yes stop_codon:yes gene_type:complete
MVYLREVEIKVGALVLYTEPRSLEPLVCVVTKDRAGNMDGDFCEIMLPSGKVIRANRLYLRRVK